MRKLLLLASAAAMAASMPAMAKKGGDDGRGHGGGKGHAAQAHSGGGGKQARGNGRAFREQRAQRPHRVAFRDGGKPAKVERRAQRELRHARVRDDRRVERRAERQQRRFVEDRVDRRRAYERRIDDRRAYGLAPVRSDSRGYRYDRDDRYASNCPPGLAKKRNGCLPPGQAKKAYRLGERVQRTSFNGYRVPAEYRRFYYDTPSTYYRYDDGGYIYRVSSSTNLITGLVPLLGGGFAVGQPLPSGYDIYNVPMQYRDTWYDTDDYNYRYADDAIYRVDAGSGIIDGIVSLLAGDLNVGQMLPTGYDAYNVPLDYRDQYYDNDDYMYRYADGNIYQVDAKTQIIQAIVEMLV